MDVSEQLRRRLETLNALAAQLEDLLTDVHETALFRPADSPAGGTPPQL